MSKQQGTGKNKDRVVNMDIPNYRDGWGKRRKLKIATYYILREEFIFGDSDISQSGIYLYLLDTMKRALIQQAKAKRTAKKEDAKFSDALTEVNETQERFVNKVIAFIKQASRRVPTISFDGLKAAVASITKNELLDLENIDERPDSFFDELFTEATDVVGQMEDCLVAFPEICYELGEMMVPCQAYHAAIARAKRLRIKRQTVFVKCNEQFHGAGIQFKQANDAINSLDESDSRYDRSIYRHTVRHFAHSCVILPS